MGDVAVGARSGASEEPEERPVTPGATPEDGRPAGPPDAGGQAPGDRAPAEAGGDDGRHGGGTGNGTGAAGPSGVSRAFRAEGEDGGNNQDGEDAEDAEDGLSHRKGAKQRSFWKELPILIGVALVLALLIKTFLVQAFSIPSDSMQDTLQRGDRVLVDKLTPWFGSTPERGEVVVFQDPGGWLPPPVSEGGAWAQVQKGLSFIGLMPSAEDQNLIKRVIAVGGDTVECQVGGQVTVNGVPVDERDFIYPGTPGDLNDPANTPCDDRAFGPIEIPEGRLWVMGDDRQDSQDSRFHVTGPGGGTVSEDEVVGRALVIAWPVTRWSFLPVPDGYSAVDSALAAAAPAALGLVGALPLVLWRRRLLLHRP